MDLTPAITTMALGVEPKNISNLPCHATTPNNYYYYYKCHGLECCHHIVAGALYKNLDLNLHSSMQTSADHRSRWRHVSRMTDEKAETWSPSRMSKVRSRL